MVLPTFPTFFSDRPIEVLLGEGVKASQLNDTVLGSCLDRIHDQLGKQVKNPTTRWIFACFNGIHLLYSNQNTNDKMSPT